MSDIHLTIDTAPIRLEIGSPFQGPQGPPGPAGQVVVRPTIPWTDITGNPSSSTSLMSLLNSLTLSGGSGGTSVSWSSITGIPGDNVELSNLFAAKANKTDVAASLLTKVDSSSLTTLLATKVDASALTGLLAGKVDTSSLSTLLDAKGGIFSNQSWTGSNTFTAPVVLGSQVSFIDTSSFSYTAAAKEAHRTALGITTSGPSGPISYNDLTDKPIIPTRVSLGIGVSDSVVFGQVEASAFKAGSNAVVLVNTSLSLDFSHNGKLLVVTSGAAATITVGPGLPSGFNCMLLQSGAGTVTIVASGVAIASFGGVFKLGGQYAAASLLAIGPESYVAFGNLTA